MRQWMGYAGAAVSLLLVIIAISAPLIAPHDPHEIDLTKRFESSSFESLLGRDELGRDNLSRLIYGSRVSVIVSFTSVGISLIAGIIIGSLAGYLGGKTDEAFIFVIDILLAFPGIILAIALTAVLGPSVRNEVIALSVLGWVGYARLARGQALAESSKDYVAASVSLGAGTTRVVFRHIVPNIMPTMIVQATFGLGGAILAEASLSFLGLGPSDVPSWGTMLASGADYLLTAPYLSIYPGAAIMITVLGFNLLGDWLRDKYDPKLK